MSEIMRTIFLGIIQGLTEFLPVSSSGHLLLFRKLFGLAEAGLLLDTMLHLGTLLAILIIFRRDIWDMIRKPFSHLTLLVIVGTIPTAIIGLLFKDVFEDLARTGATVGWEFLVTGFVLWFADSSKHKGYKKIEQITFVDAIIVGVLQGMAILPAISRSGLTIAGAFFRKIDRASAAKFSFLLSIPAIMGAVVIQVPDVMEMGQAAIGYRALAIGTLVAAVTGYLAVKWMLAIIQKGSLKVFAVYVWALGVLVIIAQLLGRF